MQDARWRQLKQHLLDRGWTSRDDTMHAPHETMWFTPSSEHPNMASFRDRMTMVAEATSAYVGENVEQASLHEDLVSLVEALDEVLTS
jgi:hypothetical protein